MVKRLLCLCLVVPVLGVLGQPAEAGDKKALAKVKGKIYLTNDVLANTSLEALAEKFADKEPSLALERASDRTWSATLVAFLQRKPNRGPITLWIYDKDNNSKPVLTKSVSPGKAKLHFIHDLLLDGDLGFKICRTYLLQVGQIISGKKKVYAAGEALTDPKDPRCKARDKQKKAPSK